ncbi:MAG: hypothetical protein QMB65_01835, partial [Vicingaceae bacterium]
MLLFYTDGMTVWNRNHLPMLNGSNLNGQGSSTQVRIVPKPNSSNTYLIFTAASAGNAVGLCYSEVNMNLDSGLGDVTSAKNVLIYSPACEKIATIKHKNNYDIWIVMQPYGTGDIHSYLLTSNGLIATPIASSNVAIPLIFSSSAVGYFRCSPDGKKIASAIEDAANVQLFDFDNTTGLVSNALNLLGNPFSAYGIEFSSNSQVLYVSETVSGASQAPSFVTQYNLQAGSNSNIINSRVVIDSLFGFEWRGALSRGPDGKIYHAVKNHASLDVINSPNSLGASCNYVSNQVYLNGKITDYGLPQFLNNYNTFYVDSFCLGESTQFELNASLYDSLYWNFGDITSGINNNSKLINPSHNYNTPGTYLTELLIYYNGSIDTLSHNIEIY